MDLFTYTGCYQTVVMDRGSNFCGALTQEFLNRLDISPRFLSPAHPQGNGVIERFNSTFKNMLHFAMREHGRAWDKAVPFLLWALREVPNSTTGLSPFMLQFGIPPRGMLSILKDTWTGQRKVPTSKTVEQYMNELTKRITSASQYADEHSKVAQEQYAKYHNKCASDKSFTVDEQVIVLEKDSNSKIYAQWKTGTIAKVLSPYSYLVNMPNGACRHIYANKIRKFVVQDTHIGIVRDSDVDFGDVMGAPTEQLNDAQQCKPSQEIDKSLLEHLSDKQQSELLSVLDDFGDCFSDRPGFCPIIEHEIHVISNFKTRQCKAYRVPEILKDEIEKQVDQLLKMSFIVPSTSPMTSGVVCVIKPDKTVRLTCDYRYLNQYTIGDCQPMPNIVDSMYRVTRAGYISLCDAKSGY